MGRCWASPRSFIACDYQTAPRGTRRKACLAPLTTAWEGQVLPDRGEAQPLSPNHGRSPGGSGSVSDGPHEHELADAEHDAPDTNSAERPRWQPPIQATVELSCFKPRTPLTGEPANVPQEARSHSQREQQQHQRPDQRGPHGQQRRRSSTCYASGQRRKTTREVSRKSAKRPSKDDTGQQQTTRTVQRTRPNDTRRQQARPGNRPDMEEARRNQCASSTAQGAD